MLLILISYHPQQHRRNNKDCNNDATNDCNNIFFIHRSLKVRLWGFRKSLSKGSGECACSRVYIALDKFNRHCHPLRTLYIQDDLGLGNQGLRTISCNRVFAKKIAFLIRQCHLRNNCCCSYYLLKRPLDMCGMTESYSKTDMVA